MNSRTWTDTQGGKSARHSGAGAVAGAGRREAVPETQDVEHQGQTGDRQASRTLFSVGGAYTAALAGFHSASPRHNEAFPSPPHGSLPDPDLEQFFDLGPGRAAGEGESSADVLGLDSVASGAGSVDYLTRLDIEALMDVEVGGSALDRLVAPDDLTILDLEHLMALDVTGGSPDDKTELTALDIEDLMDLETSPVDPAQEVALMGTPTGGDPHEGVEPGPEPDPILVATVDDPPPAPDPQPPSTIGALSDTDAAANLVVETVVNGASARIVAHATDPDPSDSVTYSLTDDAGGRFAIDANTGAITVANAGLLDYEAANSHNVTVRATSTDGSTSDQGFTVNLSDDNTEFTVTAVTDGDIAADLAGESVANGAVVGVTALASDGDGSDSVAYSLTDDAGGRFTIDANTGVVTVANAGLLDYETATSHNVTVRAISTDGSTSDQGFTVGLSDDNTEFSVTAVSDTNVAADSVGESVVNGTVVGVTAFASDADATDSVTYSLTDDAGGRFTIDANTGVVTVANAGLLNYETATSHNITVRATSTDGSTSDQGFTVGLSDDNSEFSVTAISDTDVAADAVGETVANGTVVGVTAFASDADGTDSVTYSLTDDAGGRFAINATTGVVTVADAGSLDYETATSHNITVRATSDDASTSDQGFTVNLSDDKLEFSVSAVSDTDVAADNVGESAANGTVVGVTAFASDADGTDTVTYSLTDDAGGRFAINATTGVVTVADNTLLDYETATSHNITVRATSTDASTSDQGFTVNLSDDNLEFSVSAVSDIDVAADNVGESVANGTAVGVTAFASDADGTDTVTYSLTDDAGGRFAINATTGVVTVADNTLLDYETATSHNITVRATSTDASTSDQGFTVNLSDDNLEFSVSAVSDTDVAADTVGETVVNGTVVGVTAFASDADGSDTVTYSLTDDAGGRFAIDANTGVVTVADNTLLDYETATSHNITVRATSTDGSTSDQGFTINLSDDSNEFLVSAVSDTDAAGDSVGESAVNGTVVGVTAFASDGDVGDTVTYSLTDDAGGRFTIDTNTGVVTVADNTLLDYETATSHNITVRATSTDTSTSDQGFTINLSDDNLEFSVSAVSDTDVAADNVGESAANGTVVGVTAFASDADGTDTVSYSLTDDAGGRFAINATTGVVTVADNTLLDYETATSHNITVRATSDDGSTSDLGFTINLSNDNDAPTDLTLSANTVGEDGKDGLTVATVTTTDQDTGDTATYSLVDDAGGRFAIDANTGAITVANEDLIDYEVATSLGITVEVTDSGGLTYGEAFTINVADFAETNVITGTIGADVLIGTGADDTIQAGAGNDTVEGGGGDDILNGGAGMDMVTYVNSTSGVTIDLDSGTVSGGYATGDQLSFFETYVASNYNDTLIAGFTNVTFYGGDGDDTLIGQGGIDNLYGDEGDDFLKGLVGGDILDGGAGIDTASYEGSNLGVTVDLGAGSAFGGDATGDTLTSIENILGSSHDDTLTGDAGANVLTGDAGDDTLEGGDGDDILTGGAGNDIFVYAVANTGDDTIVDFTATEDTIDVTSFGLTDINDLTIVDDGGGNAQVFLPSGDSVTLTGIDHTTLVDGDFVF